MEDPSLIQFPLPSDRSRRRQSLACFQRRPVQPYYDKRSSPRRETPVHWQVRCPRRKVEVWLFIYDPGSSARDLCDHRGCACHQTSAI